MVDRWGRSELHYCASAGGTAAEALSLVEAGADPGLPDKHGFTPLHMAAQSSDLAVAKVLLAHGAPVDAVNRFGNTPLFMAVFSSKGDGELIRLLRQAGADPYRPNASGQTPIGLSRLIANYGVRQFFADLE